VSYLLPFYSPPFLRLSLPISFLFAIEVFDPPPPSQFPTHHRIARTTLSPLGRIIYSSFLGLEVQSSSKFKFFPFWKDGKHWFLRRAIFVAMFRTTEVHPISSLVVSLALSQLPSYYAFCTKCTIPSLRKSSANSLSVWSGLFDLCPGPRGYSCLPLLF